jgi:hypothetical protein
MARQGLKLGAIMASLMAILTSLLLWYVFVAEPPATYPNQSTAAPAVTTSVVPQSGPASNARTR